MPLPLILVLIMILSVISIMSIVMFFVEVKANWYILFISPLIFMIIWMALAEQNRPYIIIETDIHTINGIQVCTIDGNPINITQLAHRIYDDKQTIRIRKYEYWSYGILYPTTPYKIEQ